jgi:hypothetical protein
MQRLYFPHTLRKPHHIHLSILMILAYLEITNAKIIVHFPTSTTNNTSTFFTSNTLAVTYLCLVTMMDGGMTTKAGSASNCSNARGIEPAHRVPLAAKKSSLSNFHAR